jgi:hypothetical protein
MISLSGTTVRPPTLARRRSPFLAILYNVAREIESWRRAWFTRQASGRIEGVEAFTLLCFGEAASDALSIGKLLDKKDICDHLRLASVISINIPRCPFVYKSRRTRGRLLSVLDLQEGAGSIIYRPQSYNPVSSRQP